MPKHLKRRYRTWSARLAIPKEAQHVLGKREFVRSLGTDSRKEAERLAGPIIAAWRCLIERARSTDPHERELESWRYALRTARESGNMDLYEALEGQLEEHAQRLEKQRGYDHAKLWYDRASGNKTDAKELWEQWLAGKEDHEPAKSITMRRQALRLLTKHHPTIETVTRRAAARFIETVLSDGRSPQTVSRMLSTYSTFWRWLRAQGHVQGENPWTEQRPSRKRNGGRTEEQQRRPFTDDEAGRMFAAVDAHADKYPADPLVVRIMAVTGMRLDEVCSLQVKDVEPQKDVLWVHIRNGKTHAAKRDVPIVDQTTVGMLLQRIKDVAKHESPSALFPEYKPKKPSGSWSAAVSKRLGRRLEEISDDPRLAQAHSWRHRAKSKLEAAGLGLMVQDRFLGHTLPAMNSRYYHPEPAELIKVAETLRLPEQLQGYPK